MDEVRIRTPENVEFTCELAGLGSRFLAYSVDSVLQIAFLAIVLSTIAVVEALWPQHGIDEILQALQWGRHVIIVALLLFCSAIFLGYYIFFEAISGGQTPGKRMLGIRVIRDDGSPVKVYESAVRNFFRVIDFLPFGNALGIILILLGGRRQRLGDIVAGTIVVRTAHEGGLSFLPEMEVEAGPPINLVKMTEEDYSLVRLFLMRRDSLKAADRMSLAQKLALPLREKLLEQVDGYAEENEEFLERLAMEYRKARTFH
jgi:uncharacterized RDD family membrane protein YckC